MMFVTKSGSTYEVDQVDKRVRRLNGVDQPTPRMGKDGEWRSYEDIMGLQVGSSVVIMWSPQDTPPLPDTSVEEGGAIMPITQTSVVEQIIDVATTETSLS
jgi:hypothetical protein